VNLSSILLVHGAGSGPWIFDGWARHFEGAPLVTVDLHEGLDVSFASMADYAAAIERAADELPRPRAVVAWSMGGLVALMAARVADVLVLLEPSPPGEVQGFRPELALAQGAFDPEREYGAFPDGIRARLESELARRERKRGISVPTLECTALAVWGDWEERGRAIAALYGVEELRLPGKSHWDLVLDDEAISAIASWLEACQPSRSTG
jgi:pimeloyl-ACP methyl ester carboxylesterase